MAGSPKFDFSKYFRETKAEIRKVTWPTRKELIQHTEVVITSIFIIGFALWIVDLGFGAVLDLILNK